MPEIKKLSDYFHYKGNGEEGYAEVKTYSPNDQHTNVELNVFAIARHLLPTYPFNQIKFLAKVNRDQTGPIFDNGDKLVHIILAAGQIMADATFNVSRVLDVVKNQRLSPQGDPDVFEDELFQLNLNKTVQVDNEDIIILFVQNSLTNESISKFIDWFTDFKNFHANLVPPVETEDWSIEDVLNKRVLGPSSMLVPDPRNPSDRTRDYSRLTNIGTFLTEDTGAETGSFNSFARAQQNISNVDKCIKTIFSRKVTGFDIVKRIDDISIHRELSAEAADFINKLVAEYASNGQTKEEVIQNIIDLNNNTFVVADEETP